MRLYNEEILLSGKSYKDIIVYNDRTYLLKSYSKYYRKARGSNSFVFQCKEADSGQDFIIKFNKYDDTNVNNANGILRFNREIEALSLARDHKFENVISYYFDDYKRFGTKLFHYYIMEKGESDLTSYLYNNKLSDQQKLFLCIDILDGIKQLHSINIYHRDIKPDNIFFVDRVWKVGDLGLSDNRNTDFPINETGNKIGPYGWLSPEAMNKFLCEKNNIYGHDCDLNTQSDVFQLGKLFWFIFQGNVPIGQVIREDFLVDNDDLFEIFYSMLEYAKNRRVSLDEIEASFKEISKNYDI